MKEESIAFGQANGYPPLATKTLCIDFDGTIVTWGDSDIYQDAIMVMKALKERGFKLIILTSRVSQRWLDHEELKYEDQYNYVANILNQWEIPYDEITSEKIPALIYYDDRAYNANNNWVEFLGYIDANFG